jgi:Flp pilus assembly protein TadB
MIILAACGGALIAAGIAAFAGELTRRAPAPGTPPGRVARGALPAAAVVRLPLALAAFLAALLVTRWPVAAVAAALAVIFLPKLTSSREQRRRTAMLEALEQWARRLADMLTASRALEDALEASARSAPPAIAGQVGALARRLSARTGTETALRAFAAEVGDPAGDRIAAALIIATSRRGGGAHAVLSALAEMLGRDVAARREIDAERAQHRTTVRWITVFIVGFTVFAVANHKYSAPYGTVPGQIVLALVAGLYAAGLTWLHRLGNIPAPGRFLDPPAGPGAAGPPGAVPAAPLDAGRRR